jgi:hypothetical protein
MLPEIGIMIGFYIILKSLSLLTKSHDKGESALTRGFSILTIIVSIICLGDLFLSGMKIPK